MLKAHFYEETYDLSPNSGSNLGSSVLFVQLLLAWTSRLKTQVPFEFIPPESDGTTTKAARPKLLFRIDDFSEDEYEFSGTLDEDGYPNGEGLLRIPNALKVESCVRGICEKSILAIQGDFAHGRISGFGQARARSTGIRG